MDDTEKRRLVKQLYWLLLALLFTALAGRFLTPTTEYLITPYEKIEQGVPPVRSVTPPSDSKPPWYKPWPGKAYAYKEPIAEDDLGPAVEAIIACERPADPTACVMDVNGKESCGVGQFQWATWNHFEQLFGEEGEPVDQLAARRMMYKALAAGYAHSWSCSRLIGLVV